MSMLTDCELKLKDGIISLFKSNVFLNYISPSNITGSRIKTTINTLELINDSGQTLWYVNKTYDPILGITEQYFDQNQPVSNITFYTITKDESVNYNPTFNTSNILVKYRGFPIFPPLNITELNLATEFGNYDVLYDKKNPLNTLVVEEDGIYIKTTSNKYNIYKTTTRPILKFIKNTNTTLSVYPGGDLSKSLKFNKFKLNNYGETPVMKITVDEMGLWMSSSSATNNLLLSTSKDGILDNKPLINTEIGFIDLENCLLDISNKTSMLKVTKGDSLQLESRLFSSFPSFSPFSKINFPYSYKNRKLYIDANGLVNFGEFSIEMYTFNDSQKFNLSNGILYAGGIRILPYAKNDGKYTNYKVGPLNYDKVVKTPNDVYLSNFEQITSGTYVLRLTKGDAAIYDSVTNTKLKSLIPNGIVFNNKPIIELKDNSILFYDPGKDKTPLFSIKTSTNLLVGPTYSLGIKEDGSGLVIKNLDSSQSYDLIIVETPTTTNTTTQTTTNTTGPTTTTTQANIITSVNTFPYTLKIGTYLNGNDDVGGTITTLKLLEQNGKTSLLLNNNIISEAPSISNPILKMTDDGWLKFISSDEVNNYWSIRALNPKTSDTTSFSVKNGAIYVNGMQMYPPTTKISLSNKSQNINDRILKGDDVLVQNNCKLTIKNSSINILDSVDQVIVSIPLGTIVPILYLNDVGGIEIYDFNPSKIKPEFVSTTSHTESTSNTIYTTYLDSLDLWVSKERIDSSGSLITEYEKVFTPYDNVVDYILPNNYKDIYKFVLKSVDNLQIKSYPTTQIIRDNEYPILEMSVGGRLCCKTAKYTTKWYFTGSNGYMSKLNVEVNGTVTYGTDPIGTFALDPDRNVFRLDNQGSLYFGSIRVY